MTHIKLTMKTSGWVAIHNNGGGKAVKTAAFLKKANKAGSFEHVCFGDEGYGIPYTYAIKLEHIVGFISWAHEHGLNASFKG